MITPLPDLLIDPVVRAALLEDLGRAGDVTAAACLPAGETISAVFAARHRGPVGRPGLRARLTVASMDPSSTLRRPGQPRDGDDLAAGDVIARVTGDARAILGRQERTALNLMSRLCGAWRP